MDSIRISELPEHEHPAQRLAQLGPQALSDSELVSLVLGDLDGLEAGRRLLSQFRSLNVMARCDVRELAAVPGVGMDKALTLAAALGLGKRMARVDASKLKMDSPEVVCQLLGQEMRALHRESLRALLLDTKYQLIRIEEISLGSLNESIAHPREIFKPALVHSAFAIIMAHNHPSGDPTPSEADKRLTRRLVEVGDLLQIPVLDHIIIGGMHAGQPSYFSFKEEEMM
jgi:DNA repair protein RadC